MADIFEKAARTARNVGGTVINSAKDIGNSIYNTTKEQSELASLNVQLSAIEKKLNASYAEIGKKYVAYISECDSEKLFDVEDIIDEMKPLTEQLCEVNDAIAKKKNEIKQNNEAKEYQKAQSEFENEKAKLDKALSLDIIDQFEYDEKISYAQKKLDNYDTLRKIALQLEMGIISKAEYDEKIAQVLD